jgi:hypothetical protein
MAPQILELVERLTTNLCALATIIMWHAVDFRHHLCPYRYLARSPRFSFILRLSLARRRPPALLLLLWRPLLIPTLRRALLMMSRRRSLATLTVHHIVAEFDILAEPADRAGELCETTR